VLRHETKALSKEMKLQEQEKLILEQFGIATWLGSSLYIYFTSWQ
jgi:hypothetical protein